MFSIEDAEHIFNAVYSIEVVFFNAIHIKALKKKIEDAMLLIKYVFVFIEYTENSIIDARWILEEVPKKMARNISFK